MSKYILAKADIDYADEFNCEFWRIFTESEWKEWKAAVKKVLERDLEIEFYFGTNEFLLFTSYDSLMRNIKAIKIDETQRDHLVSLFDEDYGTGSGFFEYVLESVQEEDTENQDDDGILSD